MAYPQRPPRYPTYIPIVVSQENAAQSGYIVDINANGACLDGMSGLREGDTVRLRGAIETNIATVRWQENGRAGVYFERPLPPQHLAMLRLRSQAYQPGTHLTNMGRI